MCNRVLSKATTVLCLVSSACGTPPDSRQPSSPRGSGDEIQPKRLEVMTSTGPVVNTEVNVNITSGGNAAVASNTIFEANTPNEAKPRLETNTAVNVTSKPEERDVGDAKNPGSNSGTVNTTTQSGDNAEAPQPIRPPTETEGGHRELREICGKLTERANQSCKKQVAGLYQSSCNHYLKAKGPCEEQIRFALECQFKAPNEVFCAHEADHNCSKVNRALKTCQRGTAPVEQTTDEDDRTLPANWQSFHDEQLGFTVSLPSGAILDTVSKRRTWKVEEGAVSYSVAELAPYSGKLENQAFVRIVVGYVGSRCQLRLKLNGELQLKGTTVVQYQSGCPDGTEWHGMLHFWGGRVVSTAYHAPAGVEGVRDPFFYSFAIDSP